LTEEEQGGTAPQPEATASAPDEAPEQTAAAVAVADEPAITEDATQDASETVEAVDTAEVAASADADVNGASVEAVAAPVEDAAPVDETAAADGTASAEEDAPAEAATPVEDAAREAEEAPAEATAPEATAPEASGPAEPEAAPPTPDVAEATDSTAEAEAPAAIEEAPPTPPRDLGPEPTTMEELLAEQTEDIKSFKHGDVVEGNVVRIDKDEILVDIGAKSEGVVSNRELYGRHAETQPQLNIGDTVLVYVLQPESPEGHAVLSLRRAGLERKWRSMQEQFEAGVIIEAPVIDHNKGGLIVDCGIRGFVPISQIVDFPRRPQNDQPRDAAQEIAEKLQPFVGRKLRLKILEVNRKANRLILSEKVALYEERREKRDELFSSLQVGQKVSGTVRSIAPFGVFIDLGGIDGLVHKSELSWNKVNNPEAGYHVGDEVEAEVIDINHERGRISLSIRRLQPDPWHSTVADFKVGDIIDGTVTKLVNFGAFVRVRDGLEGLIHISELSHQRVAHPGDVVHEGQTLKLRIISLDSERHRLGLSLKQAEEAPARPAPEPSAPRGERRPRTERAYAPSDAIQEPEGGIDNTLAAAFAQVREQVAAAEAAESAEDVPEAQAGGQDLVAPPELETAPAAEPEAVAETQPAAEPEAVSETDTLTAPEPEALAEPITDAVEAAPEAEAVAATEPEVESAPAAETSEAAEPEPASEPEPEAIAEPVTEESAADEATPAEAEAADVADAPAAGADAEEAPAAEATTDEPPAETDDSGETADEAKA
jgi:small subunit ribosomal protein S1